MSVGELAAMVSAIAFCVLVALIAVPLLKLGKTLDETTEAVRRVSDETVPLLKELTTTAANATIELDKLSVVTDDAGKVASHAASVTEDAAQFSSLMGAVVRKPLVKTAAFTYGVRKALGGSKR